MRSRMAGRSAPQLIGEGTSATSRRTGRRQPLSSIARSSARRQTGQAISLPAAVQRRSSAALGAFERTRPMVAAQAIGIGRAALEFARDYAVSREAFGQPIIENQGVSFPLADIAADIDAARLLTWRAAWMAAQRKPFEHAEGSMSKLKASEVAVRACEQAIQTLGGWGYVKDFPVEKWYRDAKLYTIFEGTSEIQRLVIGRALRAEADTEPLDRRMETPR